MNGTGNRRLGFHSDQDVHVLIDADFGINLFKPGKIKITDQKMQFFRPGNDVLDQFRQKRVLVGNETGMRRSGRNRHFVVLLNQMIPRPVEYVLVSRFPGSRERFDEAVDFVEVGFGFGEEAGEEAGFGNGEGKGAELCEGLEVFGDFRAHPVPVRLFVGHSVSLWFIHSII